MALPEPVADLTECFLQEVDTRLPGRMTGLLLHGSICWGEFFAGSDIDFVGLWDELPTGTELDELEAAHQAVRQRFPAPPFDGFHCTPADLAAGPATVRHRPAYYRGAFDPAGTIDINLVTWHELAERGIAVRGAVPAVYTNLGELLGFTRDNLDTYWRGQATEIEAAGVDAVGEDDDAVVWVGLGAARLHHLLTTHELTSKSGAGRYVRSVPDPRWHRIAEEALRIREQPTSPRLYDDPGRRGRDLHALLTWLVDDGTTAHPAGIRLVGWTDALPLAEKIWRCYDTVFGDFADDATWRSDLFERHAGRAGYRLAYAVEDDGVIGFGWGYVGQRGQHFPDLICAALPQDVASFWVGDHFDLVELAVLPTHRRRGLGQALHDRLLDGVRRRCLLTTDDDVDDPAVQMYLRSGWRRIGVLRPGRQVMGLDRSAVVLMYEGWQVWDGEFGRVYVAGEFGASVEFVQRSALEGAEPGATLQIQRTHSNWYRATARMLDTTDAVVLDLGPFRALRWVRPGESPGDFTTGDTVSLDLSLNLNAWQGSPWTNRAADLYGSDHRWRVERIVRTTQGLDDAVEIDEAAMETVDGTYQYCLLHCTLVR